MTTGIDTRKHFQRFMKILTRLVRTYTGHTLRITFLHFMKLITKKNQLTTGTTSEKSSQPQLRAHTKK